MAKYLIVLAGLLVVGSVQAKCELGGDPSCFDDPGPSKATMKYEAEMRRLDGEIKAAQDAREQEYENQARMREPVIVNGPEGSRMYYPSGDGKFYQSYR